MTNTFEYDCQSNHGLKEEKKQQKRRTSLILLEL